MAGVIGMADFTITLTPAQVQALKAMPGPALRVLQDHLDDWLAPYVAKLADQELREVAHAYSKAAEADRQKVRQDLGLP